MRNRVPRKRNPTHKKGAPLADNVSGDSLWLRGDDSPFGMDVLDCRPMAQSYVLSTADERIADSFAQNTRSNGSEYIGKFPENPVRFDHEFSFTLKDVRIKDGPLFVASCMEEKWNIYYYNHVMYFVRSWTGNLIYAALCNIKDDTLFLSSVVMNEESIDPGDRFFPLREVFFLIVSHVLGNIYPHPVPARIGLDEGKILLFSFSQYGRMGLFASVLPPGPESEQQEKLDK